MDIKKKSLEIHKSLKGKIEIKIKPKIKSLDDLKYLYTPGASFPSLEIQKDETLAYDYTSKSNTIAIVTDGSRVLGLGNVGPKAALPIMEGKSMLFKYFANVDAVPICLDTQDADEIVETVKRISPAFGGINLEDIDSPKCFDVEERLRKELKIPVFHDDQHGTGIVALAALINALKIVGKDPNHARVVVMGAGSAGTGISRVLHEFGVKNILVVDSKGIIFEGRSEGMNRHKNEIAKATNPQKEEGSYREALKNADVLISVTGVKNSLTADDIRLMNEDPIVFALSNPDPDIMPKEAKKGGARIVGTGRSDFPNQINNSLVFPGIFRGLLDIRAMKYTNQIAIDAAKALAGLVGKKQLREDFILPKVTDKRIVSRIASSVKQVCDITGNCW